MNIRKVFNTVKNKEMLTSIIKIHLIYMVLRVPLAFSSNLLVFLGIGWLQTISFEHFGYDFHWIFAVVRFLFAIGIVVLSYNEIKYKDAKWKYYVMYVLYFIVTLADAIVLHTLSMVFHQ